MSVPDLTLLSAQAVEPFGDTYADAYFHDTFRLAEKPLPGPHEQPWQVVVDPDGMPLGMSTCGRSGGRITATIAVNKWAANGSRGRTVTRMLREGLPAGAVTDSAEPTRHNPDRHQVKVAKLLRMNPIASAPQPDLFETSDTSVSIPWQHATPEQLLAAAADNRLPWSDLAEIDDYILERSRETRAGGDLQDFAAWHGVAGDLAVVLDESFLAELHALKKSVALVDVDDAESAEEVQRELVAGNPYLLDSMRAALYEIAHNWEKSPHAYGEEESIDVDDVILTKDFRDALIAEVDRVDLRAFVPLVDRALADEARRARKAHRCSFVVTPDPGRGFVVFRGEYEASFFFSSDFVPVWADAVPPEMVADFWSRLGTVDWDAAEGIQENFGHAPGGAFYVVYDSVGDLNEWAVDLISEAYDEIAEADPEGAAESVLSTLPFSLKNQIAEAKLSTKEIADLGRLLFDGSHSTEGDFEEALDEIREYLDDLTARVPDDRRVLAIIDRAQLRQWGITSGVLWEEAPWSLIVLVPSELRFEGMQMRHCVGDKGMGYIRAVREGDIEIWSLRSANGKPRFTLEVEPRGDLAPRIRQLKGKANRTPGYASAREDRIVFPEEVILWWHLLEQLGIPREEVNDFPAIFHPDSQYLWDAEDEVRPPAGHDGGDAPRPNLARRPLRNFNTPWRP